jgi:uncharacterized protein
MIRTNFVTFGIPNPNLHLTHNVMSTDSIRPVSSSERYPFLDTLRGFALFGVLMANMATHSGFYFISGETKDAMATASSDHVITWLLHFLVEGKFYSLFSLLFGIGFAIQLQRSSSGFSSRFILRLSVLFLFGLIHATFFYVGDILTVYALTGMALLLFRNASNRTLLWWAIVMLLFPLIQYSFFWAQVQLADPVAAAGGGRSAFFDRVVSINQTGSFSEIIINNIGGLIFGRYPDLFFTGRFFRVLAMFLVGFYVTRTISFSSLGNYTPFLKKTLIISALIGVPCNILLAMMMETNAYYAMLPGGIIQPLVYAFGVPALGIFYAVALALLFQKESLRKRIGILAPVGQLALTNYLMQSVICCFIFMSYGGGWYGKIGPTMLALIGIAIFVAQVFFSHWWLRYYRFGPMEWIWRSLTYRKWQPIKREPVVLEVDR